MFKFPIIQLSFVTACLAIPVQQASASTRESIYTADSDTESSQKRGINRLTDGGLKLTIQAISYGWRFFAAKDPMSHFRFY
jgi:hypothetical protein